MKFVDLGLAEPVLRAVSAEGYVTATPVQAQSIPHVLAGRDLVGCAQTGTGKTAAFALPILHRLADAPKPSGPAKVRCLVLCPTRELATQIGDSFRAYGKNLHLKHTVIFGGVGQGPQADAVRRGVDVVVATPGRLLDLLNQRLVDLRHVQVLVLDEADRMLDMGFIHDVRRIAQQVPAQRQTLLFSATMPDEIRKLADSLLKNPARVQVAPVSATADRIEQAVYMVAKANKPQLLAHLFNELPIARGIVFTRTKHGADRVVRQLHARGVRAEAIHGNKSQNARQRALDNFKTGRTPLLVATDIASRGIDVDDVSHVVNYDVTHEPETYVHRIGRTARAGAAGVAISLCDPVDEGDNLRAIEKLIRRTIPVRTDHPVYEKAAAGVKDTTRPSQGRPQPAARPHPRQGERHRPDAPRPDDGRPPRANPRRGEHRAPAQPVLTGASRPTHGWRGVRKAQPGRAVARGRR